MRRNVRTGLGRYPMIAFTDASFPNRGVLTEIGGRVFARNSVKYAQTSLHAGQVLAVDEIHFTDILGGVKTLGKGIMIETAKGNLVEGDDFLGQGWVVSEIEVSEKIHTDMYGEDNAQSLTPSSAEAYIARTQQVGQLGGDLRVNFSIDLKADVAHQVKVILDNGLAQEQAFIFDVTTEWQRFYGSHLFEPESGAVLTFTLYPDPSGDNNLIYGRIPCVRKEAAANPAMYLTPSDGLITQAQESLLLTLPKGFFNFAQGAASMIITPYWEGVFTVPGMVSFPEVIKGTNHHGMMTYLGDQVKLYWDGELLAEGTLDVITFFGVFNLILTAGEDNDTLKYKGGLAILKFLQYFPFCGDANFVRQLYTRLKPYGV